MHDITIDPMYSLFGFVRVCLWNASIQNKLASTPHELGMKTVPSIFSKPYKLHTKLFVNKLMKGRGDNDPQDLLFVISIAVKTELNCKLKKNIGPANWRPVTNIPQKDVYCPCCGLISRDVNLRFTLLPLIERDSETLDTGNLVMCLKIM